MKICSVSALSPGEFFHFEGESYAVFQFIDIGDGRYCHIKQVALRIGQEWRLFTANPVEFCGADAVVKIVKITVVE